MIEIINESGNVVQSLTMREFRDYLVEQHMPIPALVAKFNEEQLCCGYSDTARISD